MHRRRGLGDGHTYVTYGPLAVGATEIIFEGVPTFPGICWPFLGHDPETRKCGVLHRAYGDPLADQGVDTTPTLRPANTIVVAAPARLGRRADQSGSLDVVPQNIGGERCPIVDTFWQTETGGHMITPLPGVTPLVPGSCTQALPGIASDCRRRRTMSRTAPAASWSSRSHGRR